MQHVDNAGHTQTCLLIIVIYDLCGRSGGARRDARTLCVSWLQTLVPVPVTKIIKPEVVNAVLASCGFRLSFWRLTTVPGQGGTGFENSIAPYCLSLLRTFLRDKKKAKHRTKQNLEIILGWFKRTIFLIKK